MRVVVYTAFTAGYDTLQAYNEDWPVRFVAFLQESFTGVQPWERRPLVPFSLHPLHRTRRNARIYKVMPHVFLDCDYSVWVDGHLKLLRNPIDLIDKYLSKGDLALPPHPGRSSYEPEAEAIKDLSKDDPEVIDRQVAAYKAEESKLPGRIRMPATGVVVRRHTHRVAAFNQAWWEQICLYSSRDQMSFDYVSRKIGLPWVPIEEGLEWVAEQRSHVK